MVERRKVKDT